MDRMVTSVETLPPQLKASFDTFVDFIRFLRMSYIMDELWDGKETLKFRKGGKTLVTIALKDGLFNVLIIFGKAEREQFEQVEGQFSDFIRRFYHESKTFHDGKWMFIDIEDGTYLEDIKAMVGIKKKPNRKDKYVTDALGRCGCNCEACLIYARNNENDSKHSELFHEMDWHCYHSPDEERADYTQTICPGCAAKSADGCTTIRCLDAKEYKTCFECDYQNCTTDSLIKGFDPGLCNLGITAEEMTRAVLPYCGKERYNRMKAPG